MANQTSRKQRLSDKIDVNAHKKKFDYCRFSLLRALWVGAVYRQGWFRLGVHRRFQLFEAGVSWQYLKVDSRYRLNGETHSGMLAFGNDIPLFTVKHFSKIVLWGLFLVFGLQATKMDELLKAPLLIEHFVQHEQMFPGISVYNFIKIHYLDEQNIDGDYAEDMKLPFKTVDCHFQSIQLFTPPAMGFHTLSSFPIFKEKFPHNTGSLPIPFLLDVFLPPRLS